jgi:hypothetical protein
MALLTEDELDSGSKHMRRLVSKDEVTLLLSLRPGAGGDR